jgi:hypothetical protein
LTAAASSTTSALVTPAALRKLALSLPEAGELPHFERVSWRVRNKIFATMTPDGKEAMVRVPRELVASLLAEYPEVFFSYGGWTDRGGAMGVKLAAANGRMMGELVVGSWRSVAPRKLVAAYDA